MHDFTNFWPFAHWARTVDMFNLSTRTRTRITVTRYQGVYTWGPDTYDDKPFAGKVALSHFIVLAR